MNSYLNSKILTVTYLNSSNSPDDQTSKISGYNLVYSDHPLNSTVEEFAFTIKITYPYE